MKPYALTVIFFCAAFQAFSQSPDAGQQLIREKCGTLHVHLPLGQNGQGYPVLFDGIRVVDLRRDTSRIGLIGSGRESQEEVLLGRPVAEQVAAWLNAGYSRPQGKHRLLVAVKDLWVSGRPPTRRKDRLWKVAFRFEAYLTTDGGYIPLTYLDTVVRADDYRAEDMAAENLPDLMAVFMDKVATHVMTDDIATRSPVSYDQIDSFSRTRFNYPMDTATILVKGVYANAREFRNNAPSKTTYQISKDDSDNLVLQIPDENGQFHYAAEIWGFCDGKQAYVMRHGDVSPIFSVHHQFYVLGSRDYRIGHTELRLARLLPLGDAFIIDAAYSQINNPVTRKLWVFRLDVHSGKVTE
jgi:hypothetical protein